LAFFELVFQFIEASSEFFGSVFQFIQAENAFLGLENEFIGALLEFLGGRRAVRGHDSQENAYVVFSVARKGAALL